MSNIYRNEKYFEPKLCGEATHFRSKTRRNAPQMLRSTYISQLVILLPASHKMSRLKTGTLSFGPQGYQGVCGLENVQEHLYGKKKVLEFQNLKTTSVLLFCCMRQLHVHNAGAQKTNRGKRNVTARGAASVCPSKQCFVGTITQQSPQSKQKTNTNIANRRVEGGIANTSGRPAATT
jgi:hypothetical protein